MSTKPLWITALLAGCTANAASPEPSAHRHPCAPESRDDIEPHDVLRIASADGSVDLVVHAWTDREGTIVDVHTVSQPSIYAEDLPTSGLAPAHVHVESSSADAWRLVILDGAVRHELHVANIEDDVVALASVVTGDDEPTWCRLHAARLTSQRVGRVLAGAGRIEARCEDASGTDVEGWVAAASR